MVESIVQAHGVRKTFGKQQVLDDIDLEVRRGSVLALLGPNGAGKTTTVRILTTLLKPDSGSITVAGHDVLREPDQVRSRIGVVGQSVTMDNHLSGLQNMEMIGRLYHFSRKDAQRRARELIDQFGLSDSADKPVKAYSGGMRRRLDLAAGLIASPQVLFLDEPTAGLDPDSRNTAWEAIRGLVRAGTTILLTTQYLEEADQLAEAVVVIDHGRVITSATPANLKSRLGGQRLDISLADPARRPDPLAAGQGATDRDQGGRAQLRDSRRRGRPQRDQLDHRRAHRQWRNGQTAQPAAADPGRGLPADRRRQGRPSTH